jgi:hypothetical protein
VWCPPLGLYVKYTVYCKPVIIVHTCVRCVPYVQYTQLKYSQFSCDLWPTSFVCTGISTSTSGDPDVICLHAAYRRAYVLSLFTWPRTCTRPRHAHRGSDALIALPCAGLIYPDKYRLASDQPRQQLSIVGIVSSQCHCVFLNFFFNMNCA